MQVAGKYLGEWFITSSVLMLGGQMKTPLCYKVFTAIAVLMFFYPSNAISKEDNISASARVARTFALYLCMEVEGFYASGEAVDAAIARLNKEGISSQRILNLLGQPVVKQQINDNIKLAGGCTKLGKNVENIIKEYKTKDP